MRHVPDTCQLPMKPFISPLTSVPYRLPWPNGSSYMNVPLIAWVTSPSPPVLRVRMRSTRNE